MTTEADPRIIAEALANPFPPDVVKFRAGATKGERALAMAYIDARVVMDRLDDVVGFLNWKDEYTVLADGSVQCTLSIRISGEWTPKQDVGSESEQPDAGDRMKAAFSDALKRAAVKFGIGRYLYSLKSTWVDYDPSRKQLKVNPVLPDWARPAEAPPVSPERTINAEEEKEVVALLQAVEDAGLTRSLETFWEWMLKAGVKTVDQMPHKLYETAVKGLKAKLDTAKKAKVGA